MTARTLTTRWREVVQGRCRAALTGGRGAWVTDERGATTLEWALLLAGVGLPSMYLFTLLLQLLVAHYQLTTTLNSLPLP
jgi:Flp pilus assembly pilin Flp